MKPWAVPGSRSCVGLFCVGLFRGGLFLAAAAGMLTTSAPAAQVTVTKNSNTSWTVSNGLITMVFDPSAEDVTSVQLGSGSGASPNLLGGSTPELDEEFAGTPFGAGPQTFGSQTNSTSSYQDVWTTTASSGTANPITYSFHYVVFANDPTIYCYEWLSHAATDPATSVGQGQFLFRSNPSLFTNLYQINTGPNQLGAANAVTTVGVPSTNPSFPTVSAVPGRQVQNVTYDLTGSGIAGDNGTNYFTKYDYSVYTQFYQAETMYGSQYAVTEVDPSTDTLTGGPTKQNLAWTDPAILNMEFLSDHYGIDGSGSGAYPGYAYYPTQGVNTTRLFGPYGFTVSSATAATAATINQNAINAIPGDQKEFDTDTQLVASGYVPTTFRGTLQVSVSSSVGWSSSAANNTIVLSEPGVNFQESTQGYQYWGQLSAGGSTTITGVAPGTYRLSIYQSGQWGESCYDGVQVVGNKITIPTNATFTPENFGTAPPIWTIGTPNRSANEFLNGHPAGTTSGPDQRQYQGSYDYWAEEAALGNQGKIVYYATAVGGTAATNNPNAWISNLWSVFDPGEYDSSNGSADNYNNTAPQYVMNAGGPATYSGAPWEVHFTTTQAQRNQGQYVVLSVGLAAMESSLVITLNGHEEVWHAPDSTYSDPMVRSGDAGFYQWAAFQWPTSDLLAAGGNDEMTFSCNEADGVMWDALRMEITNTSADPAVTGWNDYTWVTGPNDSNNEFPNDAASQQPTEIIVPEPSTAGLVMVAAALAAFRLRQCLPPFARFSGRRPWGWRLCGWRCCFSRPTLCPAAADRGRFVYCCWLCPHCPAIIRRGIPGPLRGS
jgi:hypothetical protein